MILHTARSPYWRATSIECCTEDADPVLPGSCRPIRSAVRLRQISLQPGLSVRSLLLVPCLACPALPCTATKRWHTRPIDNMATSSSDIKAAPPTDEKQLASDPTSVSSSRAPDHSQSSFVKAAFDEAKFLLTTREGLIGDYECVYNTFTLFNAWRDWS